jgi:hypothetical protein
LSAIGGDDSGGNVSVIMLPLFYHYYCHHSRLMLVFPFIWGGGCNFENNEILITEQHGVTSYALKVATISCNATVI